MSTQGKAGKAAAAAPEQHADRPSRRTLVIIPTYNERENLPLIMARVRKARPDVHILIVDDGSPDGTGQLADEMAAAEPDRIQVMHRTAKDGLGAAYLAAFAWGLERGYSVLVEMDADGSHAPEQLYRLLDAIDNGADVAIGSRYVDGGTVRNWPYRRLVLSKSANTYARVLLGVDIHDLTWRAINHGFTVAEVPITFTERELGVSKMSGSNIREAMVKVAEWGIGGRLKGRGPAR
jgi:dolichol-phosphate mannosyltransferase